MPDYKDLLKNVIPQKQNVESVDGVNDGKTKDQYGNVYQGDYNSMATNDDEKNKLAAKRMAEKNIPLSNEVSKIEAVADQGSYSPEYFNSDFAETFGRSMMKGLGQYVIGGTGDTLQLASNLLMGDMSDDGWVISRYLQDWGNSMKDNNEVFIPDELKPENLKWTSLFNPDFWSVHFAEYVPQIAQFMLLGGAAEKIAEKGAKSFGKTFLKNQIAKKGVQMLDEGIGAATTNLMGDAVEALGSGKGLIGKMYKSTGELTQGAEFWIGTANAGFVNNVATGMLNASQFVNQYRGKDIYTDEELRGMATDIMLHNALWMPIEMASWGLTYAGGWKGAQKSVTKLFNGGKGLTKPAEQIKQGMIKSFGKSAFKFMGKLAAEGTEEMFQETFEDWTQLKAEERVTGYNKYESYMDYFMSDDARATKIISAASGLGGGGFGNIRSMINQRADDNIDLLNETLMVKQKLDSSYEEATTMQDVHQSNQLMRIAYNEREDLLDGFIAASIRSGAIDETKEQEIREEFDFYKKALEDSKTMGVNTRGRYFFMENEKIKFRNQNDIKKAEQKLNEKNAWIDAQDYSKEEAKRLRNNNRDEFEVLVEAKLKNIAYARTNIANLISGKATGTIESISTISPVMLRNSKGQIQNPKIVTETMGLESEEYNQFYTKTDEQLKKEQLDNQKKVSKSISLTESGKELFNKLKNSFLGKVLGKDEDVEPQEAKVQQTQAQDISKENPDSYFEKNKDFNEFVKTESEEDYNNFKTLPQEKKTKYLNDYAKSKPTEAQPTGPTGTDKKAETEIGKEESKKSESKPKKKLDAIISENKEIEIDDAEQTEFTEKQALNFTRKNGEKVKLSHLKFLASCSVKSIWEIRVSTSC